MGRGFERNRQVLRQWRLLQLLATGRRTAPEIANELGVTIRTVYRDLGVLQEAYFPVCNERGIDGDIRWRLVGSERAPDACWLASWEARR
jgi:predicted DNA-binding transcriptional regulator YafY